MKFIVSRTSKFFSDEDISEESKPCKEAVGVTDLTYMDWRIVKTLEECHHLLNFFDGGINHREEDGKVVREFPNSSRWLIELNSLEEMLDFVSNYGVIVL